MAWIGRNSRALDRWFLVPLLWAERVARGNVRFAWVLVMIAVLRLHQSVLIAAAGCFWAYTWAAHFYVRRQAGRALK
jgi:hypothetical protein